MRTQANVAVALSLIAMLSASSVGSAHAGTMPLSVAALNGAAIDNVTDVRFRRGGAVAAGIAFGLIGAAIAGQYAYPPYYYGYGPYPYAYGPPVYYYPSYGWGGPYRYYAYPRYRHRVVRLHRAPRRHR